MTPATKSKHQITESIRAKRDSYTGQIVIFDNNKLIGMLEEWSNSDTLGAWVFQHHGYKPSPAQQSFYNELDDNWKKLQIADPMLGHLTPRPLSSIDIYAHPYEEEDQELYDLHHETFLGNFPNRFEATNVIIKWYNLRDKQQDHLYVSEDISKTPKKSITNSHNNITESTRAVRDPSTDENILIFDGNKLIGMVERMVGNRTTGPGPIYDNLGAWVFAHPKYKKSPAQQRFYNELDDNYLKSETDPSLRKHLSRVDMYVHPYYPSDEDEQITARLERLLDLHRETFLGNFSTIAEATNVIIKWYNLRDKQQDHLIANSHNNITESIHGKLDPYTQENILILDDDRLIGMLERTTGYGINEYTNAWVFMHVDYKPSPAQQSFYNELDDNWKKLQIADPDYGHLTPSPLSRIDIYCYPYNDDPDNHPQLRDKTATFLGSFPTSAEASNVIIKWYNLRDKEQDSLYVSEDISKSQKNLIKEKLVDSTKLQENYRTEQDGEGWVHVLYNDKIIGHVITVERELDDKPPYYGELYGKQYSYYGGNSPTEVVQKIIKTHQDSIKPKIDESGNNTGYRIVRKSTTQFYNVLYNGRIIGVVDSESDDTGPKPYYGSIQYLPIYRSVWGNSITEVIKQIIQSHRAASFILPISDLFNLKESNDSEHDKSGYHIVNSKNLPNKFHVYYGKDKIGYVHFNDIVDFYSGTVLYPVSNHKVTNSKTEAIRFIINSYESYKRMLSKRKTPISESEESKYSVVKKLMGASSNPVTFVKYYGKIIGSVAKDSENSYAYYPVPFLDMLSGPAKSEVEAISKLIKLHTKLLDNPKTKIDKLDETKYIAKLVKYTMLPHSANNTEKIALFKDSEYIGMIIFDPRRDMYEVFLSTKRIGTVNSRNEGFQLIIKARNEYEKSQNITENTDNTKFTISKDLTYSYRNEQLYYKVFCNGTVIGTVAYRDGDRFYDAYYFGPGMKSINTTLKSIKNAIHFIIDKYRQNTEEKLDENKKNTKFTVVNATYKDSNQIGLYLVRANGRDIGDIRLFIEKRDNYYGRGHWSATFYAKHRQTHMNAEKLSDAVDFIIGEYKLHKKLDGDQSVSESQKRMGHKIRLTTTIKYYQPLAKRDYYKQHCVYFNNIKIGEIHRTFGETGQHFNTWLYYVGPNIGEYFSSKNQKSTLYIMAADAKKNNFQENIQRLIDKAKEIGRIPKESSDVSESQKRMGPKITVSPKTISNNFGVEKIFNIYYNGIKIGEITKSYYGEDRMNFISTYIDPKLVKYKNQKKSTGSLLLVTRPSDGNIDTFKYHLEKLIDKAKEIGRIPKESSDEITEDTKGYNVKKFEYNSTGILHGGGKIYWYDKEIVYKVMFGEELIGYVTTVYELNTLLTLDGNPYLYNNLSPNEKPVNVGRTDNLNKAIQEVINYHKNKGRKKANKLKESALYTKQIKTSVVWRKVERHDRFKKEQCILFHIGKTLIGSVVSYYNENNIIVPYDFLGENHFYIATAKGKWLPDSRKGGLLCKTLKEATDYVIDTYLKYKIGIEHE